MKKKIFILNLLYLADYWLHEKLSYRLIIVMATILSKYKE